MKLEDQLGSYMPFGRLDIADCLSIVTCSCACFYLTGVMCIPELADSRDVEFYMCLHDGVSFLSDCHMHVCSS